MSWGTRKDGRHYQNRSSGINANTFNRLRSQDWNRKHDKVTEAYRVAREMHKQKAGYAETVKELQKQGYSRGTISRALGILTASD